MILQDKNINNIMTKKRSSLTLILVYLMAGVEGATRKENKPVSLFLASMQVCMRQAGSDSFAVRKGNLEPVGFDSKSKAK